MEQGHLRFVRTRKKNDHYSLREKTNNVTNKELYGNNHKSVYLFITYQMWKDNQSEFLLIGCLLIIQFILATPSVLHVWTSSLLMILMAVMKNIAVASS